MKNLVEIEGELVRDVETRDVGTGLATFTLVNKRTFKKNDGSEGNETNYFDFKCWGANLVEEATSLNKGDLVTVKGAARVETWEDKETGKKRSKVIFNVLQFVKEDVPKTNVKSKGSRGKKDQDNPLF